MVFLIPDEPVPPHEGQLVGKRAAFYAEIIRQLLAIVGDIKGIATGALDTLREVGQQPLSNGLGACAAPGGRAANFSPSRASAGSAQAVHGAGRHWRRVPVRA